MDKSGKKRPAVYEAWMMFAKALNLVVMTVIFSLLFLVLLPFNLIRLRDPLRFRLRDRDTYWEDHQPYQATIERMTRAF